MYICADDYGISEGACRHIEECIKKGALNKISILPNSDFADCSKYLEKDNVLLALHLNLVEGKSLSDASDVSLLVSENRHFKHSFEGLLLLSLSKNRKEFERQIYKELKEQIFFWKEKTGQTGALILDSHQHTHMIPLIFKTLMRVIRDEKIDVEYIRTPSEPILPYLMTPSLYFTYSAINILEMYISPFFSTPNASLMLA